MTERIPDEIAEAPMGYVVFDEAGCIVACNNAAQAMGLQSGMQRSECFTGSGDACQLVTAGASKPVRIRVIDERRIWVEDTSEVTALTRQLQKLKRPLNQELRHVNHQATTGLGYAELLSVILDEELGIPPEKQKALQLYQGELVKTLRAIRAVLSGAGDYPQGSGNDGEILVTDKQPELAELIAELLKTRGYKSVSFTHAESVMKYLHLNRDKASLALVDDTLLAGDRPLDAVMQQEFEHLQVIRLSTVAETEENGGRLHLVKPLDFEALFKVVEGLVGESVHGS